MPVHLLRRLLPRVLALVVALVGLALLVAAGLQATVLAPETSRVGRLTSGPGAPALVTKPGVLDLVGPRVTVEARGAAADQVFVGVARSGDVETYLGPVARQQVTGLDAENGLQLQRRSGEPSMPDPAGVDIWVAQARGTGAAALTWPDRPGQWELVVAGDGSATAPSAVAMTWTLPPQGSPVPGLVAGGMLLLVGGLVGFSVLHARAGTATQEREPEPQEPARERV